MTVQFVREETVEAENETLARKKALEQAEKRPIAEWAVEECLGAGVWTIEEETEAKEG